MGIAIASSVAVQFSMKWLNQTLFETDTYYYYAFSDYKYPMLFMLTVVAVAPAIFEELAYRGFVQGALLKLVEKRQAIFLSSFVFALIHLSVLSFVWLLPFALLLGYVRIKENTIWYGVFIHFAFNAVNCVFEYFELGLY
jgi:membrane protease YdiL (CAAX protease family)